MDDRTVEIVWMLVDGQSLNACAFVNGEMNSVG